MQSFEGPYDACVGFDVGKLSHRACCVLAGGAVAFNVGVANDEAAIDRVLAEAAAHGWALAVVDQRRNIGTTVVRRARAAGVEVAYLPGIAANRASSLFPGDAKTDERDAEVIARTAMGVPQALRPVPEEGALEGARRLEAQRCELHLRGSRPHREARRAPRHQQRRGEPERPAQGHAEGAQGPLSRAPHQGRLLVVLHAHGVPAAGGGDPQGHAHGPGHRPGDESDKLRDEGGNGPAEVG